MESNWKEKMVKVIWRARGDLSRIGLGLRVLASHKNSEAHEQAGGLVFWILQWFAAVISVCLV